MTSTPDPDVSGDVSEPLGLRPAPRTPPGSLDELTGTSPVPGEIRDGSTQPGPEEPEKKAKKHRSFLAELPVLIIVALTVAVLIKTFLLQAFFIPSGSMIPTLLEGDRVLVNKLSYSFSEPARGDVVVFDSPFSAEADQETIPEKVVRNVAEALGLRTATTSDLIKRIVAVEGDTIEISDNQVLVNGAAVDETYLQPGVNMADMDERQIPAGHVWVMGDNRNHSQDSRRFGPVPVDSIVGKSFVRIWPVDRWGGL